MDNIKIGVIPAAGEGIRMGDPSIPKSILKIKDISFIERNIKLMQSIGITEFYIIVGKLGDYIKDHLKQINANITYIKQEQKLGIAHAIGLTKEYIDEPFVCILGDELYNHSNHKEMIEYFNNHKIDGLCAFMKTKDTELIKKNYSATLKDNKILTLIEKPPSVINNFLGLGTYIFTPTIFDYIIRMKPSPLRNEVEITDTINLMAQEKEVHAFFLKGEYININTQEDLKKAEQVIN